MKTEFFDVSYHNGFQVQNLFYFIDQLMNHASELPTHIGCLFFTYSLLEVGPATLI